METREAHLKEMEARLKKLASQIEHVEARARERYAEIEVHLEQLKKLQEEAKTAHERMKEIDVGKAAHHEWEHLKSGWEKVVKDTQKALNKFASKY